jgi:isopentenyl phosphate kinase
LAVKLKAARIVIGVDTDGLYDSDPKTNPNAQRYPHLTLSELKNLQGKIGKAQGADVTGGMAGKIAELIPAVEQGIPVKIVNASRGSRVYRALTEQQIEGTLIEKE